MARFAVSVFGRDRPGLMAAVSRVLADAGCNLKDTSMTILRGHVAMMLMAAGPPGEGGGPAGRSRPGRRPARPAGQRARGDRRGRRRRRGARYVAADLVDTMRAYYPASAWSPQIGVGLRAFCVDVTGHPKARSCAGLMVLLGPELWPPAPGGGPRGLYERARPDGNVAWPATVAFRGATPEGTTRLVEADLFRRRRCR